MKLRIEKWVEETRPFDEAVMEYWEESIRCYKIGAYKSAFIMSYLTFKSTIRDRILGCEYGNELPTSNPGFWDEELIPALNNPDKWEKYLNDIIETSCSGNKKDMSIIHFRHGEQVRTEYNYWRDFRNDCAHAKRQKIIDSSTVETFWNYLMGNMSKFYVLGGEDYLLREFKNLYKFYRYPSITDPEKVKHLMSDVSVVYVHNSNEFFRKVIQELPKDSDGNLVNGSNIGFWKDILESNHDNLRNGLIEVISDSAHSFFNFYAYFPQLLEMAYSLNPKFIINEVSTWLRDPGYPLYKSENLFWKLFVEILDIYNEQVSVESIINNRTLDFIRYLEPSARSLRILNRNSVFHKYIFEVSSWFFRTDASSQFDNFGRYTDRDFENIEICFDCLEWNDKHVEQINNTLHALEESMASRSNLYSRMNGFRYRDKYATIIRKNQEKIKNIPEINWEELSQVAGILSIGESLAEQQQT